MHSGYAPINGTSICYETAGTGDPIVFVHGMSLDYRMWDNQFMHFADRYHVIRYDLRGFGKSPQPDGESYAHHADLKALLDHLGISKAHLVGLSMGGRVITDFAIAYPGSVASLTLVDAVVHGYKNKSLSVAEIGKAATEQGPKAANQVWLQHDLFAPARRNPEVAKQLSDMIDDYSGWHWLNKNPWTPLDPPSMQQLHKIRAPVLVIIGELDLPDFQEVADILAAQIPDATKVQMEGVGHMSNMEGSAAFNGLLAEFLSRHQE